MIGKMRRSDSLVWWRLKRGFLGIGSWGWKQEGESDKLSYFLV